MSKKKLVVIGGGAAGFFCAVNAARLNPQIEVLLIEKTGKLLSKVKVSGGGRCNVTHACFNIADMSRQYPRGGNFVKKTFHQFFTTDTVKWFEDRGVKLKTEADGRMFPATDSSHTIINCLVKEAEQYGVEVLMKTEVERINVPGLPPDGHTVQSSDHQQTPDAYRQFNIQCSTGKKITADYICVACGGYSKNSMFSWLVSLGHSIEEPVPSLFTFNLPGQPITKLMGVSVEKTRIKITGTKLEQEGPLLVTHWGLSGPVVLKLSAWGARELSACNWQFIIVVNWLPDFTEQTLGKKFQSLRFELAAQKMGTKNSFSLPHRLWEYLLGDAGIAVDKRWADLSSKEQTRLIKNLIAGEFTVSGKTTFKEEFVTAGGIKLSEVDHTTMMSKLIPNLFFAGEILDVDGITGGFNFQHAWTSAFIAAKAIAGR